MENNYLKLVYRELYSKGIVKNQNDFGEKLGYNKSYVSELMNGRKPITEKIKQEIIAKFPTLQENTNIIDNTNSVRIFEANKSNSNISRFFSSVKEIWNTITYPTSELTETLADAYKAVEDMKEDYEKRIEMLEIENQKLKEENQKLKGIK